MNSISSHCAPCFRNTDHFCILNIDVVRKLHDLLLSFLSPAEKQLYQDRKNEKGKLELLGGRIAAKLTILPILSKTSELCSVWEEHNGTALSELLLNQETARVLRSIEIRRAPDRAPLLFLDGEGRTYPHFSISHTRDYIFCASSTRMKIGVDSEKTAPRILKVKSYFISPAEEKLLYKHFPGDLMFGGTILWTVKESVVKVLQSNLWNIMEDFTLSDVEGNNITVNNTLGRKFRGEFQEYKGHVFTVAAEEE